MKFQALGKPEGGLEFSDYGRAKFIKFLKDNPGVRLTIEPMMPESRNQRAFYHGAVLVLWAYLDGNDWRDGETLNQYHEIAKREFNGEDIVVHGEVKRVSKSTKGMLNHGYLERVIDYLVESYGIDQGLVLNPETYKKFRDEIYPNTSKYDTFIDYMKSIKILK